MIAMMISCLNGLILEKENSINISVSTTTIDWVCMHACVRVCDHARTCVSNVELNKKTIFLRYCLVGTRSYVGSRTRAHIEWKCFMLCFADVSNKNPHSYEIINSIAM